MSGALAMVAPRLAPLIGMLGGEHEGERLAALRAADGLLRRAGLTWRDVGAAVAAAAHPEAETVRPDPAPRREHRADPDPGEGWLGDLADAAAAFEALSDTERNFVRNLGGLHRAGRRPTEKQLAWLRRLAAWVRATRGAAADA